VDKTNATRDLVDETLINLYPNPSTGLFNIELKQAAVNFNKVKMYNAMGRLVSQHHVIGKSVIIDLTEQSNGFYIFEFTNGLQRIVKKAILAH
jgi:hypothetical protein